MSKLIDKLTKVGQQSPSRLGFGPPSRDKAKPSELVLAVQVGAAQIADEPDQAQDADAVLVQVDEWNGTVLDDLSTELKEQVWGVRVTPANAAIASVIKAKGADFVVFEAEGTEAAVLDGDDPAKLIALGEELDDDLARAVNSLPVDAAVFTPGGVDSPLGVADLMAIGRVNSIVGVPLLVTVAGRLSAEDLRALRDVGVRGILMDSPSSETIATTRKAIERIPPSKSKDGSRSALAPQGGAEVDHEDDEF